MLSSLRNSFSENGRGGIRTHGPVTRSPDFESGSTIWIWVYLGSLTGTYENELGEQMAFRPGLLIFSDRDGKLTYSIYNKGEFQMRFGTTPEYIHDY
jgi:hypothetical protein